jgi:hypothetical protein
MAFERKLRQPREAKILLLLAGTTCFILCFLEGLKTRVYLVHIVPLLAALATLWMLDWTRQRPAWRPWFVGAFLLVQILTVASTLWIDPYHTEYRATVDYLKQNAAPDDLIMASGEFGFDFGFEGQVTDDVRLGFYSGRRPRYYVAGFWYRTWIEKAQHVEPATYRHIQAELAAHCHDAFRNSGYTIYQCR